MVGEGDGVGVGATALGEGVGVGLGAVALGEAGGGGAAGLDVLGGGGGLDVLGGGGGGLVVLGGGGATLEVVAGAGTEVELATEVDVGEDATALGVELVETGCEAAGAGVQAAKRTRLATRMPGITSFLIIDAPYYLFFTYTA